MTWNAEVALDVRLTPRNAEKFASEWISALADYHPVIGANSTGHASIVITLPAESLRQATMTAISVVQEATGRAATSVRAMTTEAFDALAEADAGGPGHQVIPEMYSVPEAAPLLGLTRQAVLLMAQEGRIPSGRIGRTWGLLKSEVEARAAKAVRRGMTNTDPEEIEIPDHIGRNPFEDK